MSKNSTVLVFCGKKNCCPQFEKVADKVALVDDYGGMSYLTYGGMSYLTKDQLLDMAKMFRTKTDDEILDSLGIE